MSNSKISMAVIRRLPKYHRYLRELMDKEVDRISSKELSEIIGFTASQIRQDLNNFGGFGRQGKGYEVKHLYSEIGKILGLNKRYNTVIVGAGNLGQALAKYSSFSKFGFDLIGIFDVNPKVVGLRINDVPVMDMDELESFSKKENIDIGYICTNSNSAQEVAEALVKGGVSAILNFAPIDLKVDDQVTVENVHLLDNLLTLTYFLKTDVAE